MKIKQQIWYQNSQNQNIYQYKWLQAPYFNFQNLVWSSYYNVNFIVDQLSLYSYPIV